MFKKYFLFLIISIFSIILVLFKKAKNEKFNIIQPNENTCYLNNELCNDDNNASESIQHYDIVNYGNLHINKYKNKINYVFQPLFSETYNGSKIEHIISLFIEFFENIKIFLIISIRSSFNILHSYGIVLISLIKILFLWYIIIEPYMIWMFFKIKNFYLKLNYKTKKYVIYIISVLLLFSYLIYTGIIKYILNKISNFYKCLLKKVFKINEFLFNIFPYFISLLLYGILIKTVSIYLISLFIYSFFFPFPSIYSVIIIIKYIYLPNINECVLNSLTEKNNSSISNINNVYSIQNTDEKVNIINNDDENGNKPKENKKARELMQEEKKAQPEELETKKVKKGEKGKGKENKELKGEKEKKKREEKVEDKGEETKEKEEENKKKDEEKDKQLEKKEREIEKKKKEKIKDEISEEIKEEINEKIKEEINEEIENKTKQKNKNNSMWKKNENDLENSKKNNLENKKSSKNSSEDCNFNLKNKIISQSKNKSIIKKEHVKENKNDYNVTKIFRTDTGNNIFYLDVPFLLEYWLFINVLKFLNSLFFFHTYNKIPFLYEYFILFVITVIISEKLHEFLFLKNYKSSIMVRILKKFLVNIVDFTLYFLFNIRIKNGEDEEVKQNIDDDFQYTQRSNLLINLSKIIKKKIKFNETAKITFSFLKSLITENFIENVKLPLYIKFFINLLIYMPQLILLIFPSFVLKLYFTYFFFIFPIFGSLKCLEKKDSLHKKIYFICYFFFYNIASIIVNHTFFKYLPFYNLYKLLITISIQTILKYIFNILKIKN